MSGGVDFIYAPPEQKVLASCDVPDCGCRWVNLLLGWVRLPIPRRRDDGSWTINYCWGWWLSNDLAGACFRAFENDEKPIGYRCKHSGKTTYHEKA